MLIENLATGQSIKLTAKIGEESVEFETTVQETMPKKHMILADVVKKNDKVISFRGKGLIVDLHVTPPESAPMIFKNVQIELRKKQDDSLCYSISTITEAKVLNRRQSFRCYVGVATTVQCGSNHAAYDAVIKDVSTTGFSVTLSQETDFRDNQVLHTVLNDYLEEIAENFSFHLYGIIVHHEDLENGQFVYGCKLNQKVPGLETYIMKKERLRLRKANGGGSRRS